MEGPTPKGQRAPDAPATALASRLRYATRHLERQLRREDPAGLTIAQRSALAAVVRDGPLALGALARSEGLRAPTASRLVDRLEGRGLLSRSANAADRRGVLVTGTRRGADVLEAGELAGDLRLARRLAGLEPADRQVLERAVQLLEDLVARNDQPSTSGTARPTRREAAA